LLNTLKLNLKDRHSSLSSAKLENTNSENNKEKKIQNKTTVKSFQKNFQNFINILIVVPEKKYFDKIEKTFLEIQFYFQELAYNNDFFGDFAITLNTGLYSGDGNKQNQLAVNSVLSYLYELDNLDGENIDGETKISKEQAREEQAETSESIFAQENSVSKKISKTNQNQNHTKENDHLKTLSKSRDSCKKFTINLVCATRSGIFLPFLKLDNIYLLEENSTFYIQEQNGLYFDARDMLFLIHSKYCSKLTFISSLPSVRLYNFYQNHDIQKHLEDLQNFTNTNFIISQRNYKNQLFGYKIEEILSGLDNID
jgi:hypothetical protein